MGKDVPLRQTRKVPALPASFLYLWATCHCHPPGETWYQTKAPPKAVLMAGGDGQPRTEHQNHGHRTCSCCSRLAFPKPCLTPTQAQMEVKEPLRKSAFSNSRNPIHSWLCRDLRRPRESNTHHWQEQPSHKMAGQAALLSLKNQREGDLHLLFTVRCYVNEAAPPRGPVRVPRCGLLTAPRGEVSLLPPLLRPSQAKRSI